MEESVAQTGMIYQLDKGFGGIEYSPASIIEEMMQEIKNIYTELGFDNDDVLETTYTLLLEAIGNNNFGVKIMKSSDNQIILYTERTNGNFRNLGIDEDGDISYMYFATEKEKSERKMFFAEDRLDLKAIATLL